MATGFQATGFGPGFQQQTAAPPASGALGFQASAFGPGFQQQGAPVGRALGFEMVGGGGFRKLIAKTLAERYPAPKPKSVRASKRAKVLVAAAANVLEETQSAEQAKEQIEPILEQWRSQIELPRSDVDWQQLFLAQVVLFLRRQEEDEEEEVAMALLLMH